jgi:hypothetical protein
MAKRYHLTPLLWLVRDEASVKFHVASDDYFGTMATILSLLKQQIKKDGSSQAPACRQTLKNLEQDLLFLQKNYQISRRAHIKPASQKKSKRPKGKLKSQ